MSVMLACNRCGRPMQTAGLRGMCPRCLFACTTARFPAADLPEKSPVAPLQDERLEFGMNVGARGRFLLLDKLGEGGMGEVWLASDQELSPTGDLLLVALKFLSEDIRNDPRALAALRMEVLRSQKLSHPNIVKIFDLHVTPTGKPFIKMEYVDGRNLSQWLEQRPDKVMPWRMVAQITKQLAGALDYAHHNEGVVHRDIKPSNLLLADGPMVKLSDFGIAMGLREWIGGERPSVGTLWYASPQQLAGERPAPEDDIYALGVTLYELLTGSLPLEAETPDELIEKVRMELPQPVPERLRTLGRRNEVPSKLLALVQRCLEKDPLLRPKTREIAKLLPAIAETAPPPAPRRPERPPLAPDLPERPQPKRSSLAWVWPLVAVALMAVLCWQNWGTIKSLLAKTFVKPSSETNNAVSNAPPDASVGPGQNGNPEPQTTPPPPEPGLVNVRLYANASTPIRSVISEVSGTNFFMTNYEAGKGIFSYSQSLTPGRYLVALSDMQGWSNQMPVEITSGRTTNATLTLDYADLIITTEPANALVEWPDASSRNGITKQRVPADGWKGRFRTGLIRFTATNAGYFLLETNYLFNALPKQSASLHLALQKSLVPLPWERFTNSLGMEFLWVPGAMRLWACATETSVADFRRFADSAKCDATAEMISVTAKGLEKLGRSWNNVGFPQGDDYPVVGVNWNDANQFCVWLTEAEHKNGRLAALQRYRLPRVAEWALLTGGRQYPWGDDPVPVGNYSGAEIKKSAWPAPWPILEHHNDGFTRTAPIRAQGLVNQAGFYNLGGNAAEWCLEQVLCGGSWADGEDGGLEYLRTSSTRSISPDQRHDRNGFRVVIVEDSASRSGSKL